MAIRQRWKSIRILHAALLAAIGIYGVILLLVSRDPSWQAAKPPGLNPLALVVPLGVMSLAILLVIIPVIKKKRMPPMDHLGSDRVSLDDPALDHLMSKISAALILVWALCDAVAIWGLVLAFIFHTPLYFVPFAAAGALAMLYHAPTIAMLSAIWRAARHGRGDGGAATSRST